MVAGSSASAGSGIRGGDEELLTARASTSTRASLMPTASALAVVWCGVIRPVAAWFIRVSMTSRLVLPLAAAVASTVSGSRSEEHTSELQSLMRISYAVFCLKKKTKQPTQTTDLMITT